MAYTQRLGTDNPGYIVILMDQSGSMSDPFGGGLGKKCDECAKAVNRTLQEIGFSCADGETIKNRCDISVLSYGTSGSQCISAFSGKLVSLLTVSVSELAQNVAKFEKVKRKIPDGAGGIIEIEDDFPVWVEPIASGSTPMTEAFEKAYQLIANWITSHKNSFPPIVINITDGEPDNQTTAKSAAQKLSQLATNDGKVLIMNAHISNKQAGKVELPSSSSGLQDSYAQFLFDISSELPSVMIERAAAMGFNPQSGARAFVYNADAETMIRLLTFGSLAKLR